jgi:hypothetical protein
MAGALTALAGGAIGSLVTLAATAGVRFYAARGEIETHSRLVDDLNEDLERWVVDDTARLGRELRDLRNDLNKRNAFYSGEYGIPARDREGAGAAGLPRPGDAGESRGRDHS